MSSPLIFIEDIVSVSDCVILLIFPFCVVLANTPTVSLCCWTTNSITEILKVSVMC